MRRWIPEGRALWERVRRPAVMFSIGLALMTPAAGLLVHDMPSTAEARVAGLDRKVVEAKKAPGPIERLWRENAREREERLAEERKRREDTVRLAQHYDVPLKLAEQIYTIALEEDIPPRVAFGLVRTESAFNRTAVSHVGAVGYTQLLPSTARWMAPGTRRSDLFDTRTNLRLGFRYLRYLLNKYDGNMRLALTAYNRGPGTVDRLLRRGRNPENGYATKVLSPKPGRRV
jgi:soluble lytic murein transglycosylase-like protein